MMTQAADQELLALEREYWRAVVDKDGATAVRLTHDPCIIAGPGGVRTMSHEQLGASIRNSPVRIHDFTFGEDAVVRFVGREVAVVAYSMREDLTSDGDRRLLDVVDTSTWLRQDERWVCVAHTESVKNQTSKTAASTASNQVNQTLSDVREGLGHLRFGSAVSPAMPDAVEDDTPRQT